MNRHPLSLKGGATCFLMGFHAILRPILKYRFYAISAHELSVCAIFYAFYNYDPTMIIIPRSISSPIAFKPQDIF